MPTSDASVGFEISKIGERASGLALIAETEGARVGWFASAVHSKPKQRRDDAEVDENANDSLLDE
jgi:hypothetical protein